MKCIVICNLVFIGGGGGEQHRLVAEPIWLLKNQQIEVTRKDVPD